MRSASPPRSPPRGPRRLCGLAPRRSRRRLHDDAGEGRRRSRPKSKRILEAREKRQAKKQNGKSDQQGRREAMSEDRADDLGRAAGHYEPCEECGAPLDPQQRYCVNCAARRGNGANPSSRYFAAMSKKARRPLAAAAGQGGLGQPRRRGRLLRPAADRGRARGRGRPQRLRRRRQRGAAAGAAPPGRGGRPAPAPPPTRGRRRRERQESSQSRQRPTRKAEARSIAKTDNGPVHQVTGFKADQGEDRRRHADRRRKPRTGGRDYIKAQQNLPDVIVVGGDPGAAPDLRPTGVEP